MIAAIVYSILITGALVWSGMPADEAAGWALTLCVGLLILSRVCKPMQIVLRYLRKTLKVLWRTIRASARLIKRAFKPRKSTARRRGAAARTRTPQAAAQPAHAQQLPAAAPVLIQVVNNYYGQEARNMQRPTIDPEQFGLPRFGEQQLRHWDIFPPTVDAS